MIVAYVAGLVTIPILIGLFFAASFAFGFSNVLAHESQCDFCTQLGKNPHLPKGKHRRGYAQLIEDLRHRFFTARRPAHRALWQEHFENHPDWVRDQRAWKIYGTGRPWRR